MSLCLPFCQVHPLTHPPQVRELHELLRTATERVANLLNEGTQTHRLPPEILATIFDLAVDHGSEEHTKQIIPLTHVCRYWRTLLLSYPKMWSTLCMKPGNPSMISEWLERSQQVPLTIIAEFSDNHQHPPCRYQDSATATLADAYDPEVCPRHKAVLSLDQLLPHRSRIHELDILILSSDPDWEEPDHSGKPPLLYHHFFKKSLPNLKRLDLRAADSEQSRYVIPIPHLLFEGYLPRLKELKYLGVNGGLTGTVKNLVSCEIGVWLGSAGPVMIGSEEVQMLFNNNRTVKSLTIRECEFYFDTAPWVPTPIPMPDLKYLNICCNSDRDFEQIVNCIHAPQFKNLDTARLSTPDYTVRTVATDGSGHTFVSSQYFYDAVNFRPLRHLGAVITTLCVDLGVTLPDPDERPVLDRVLRSFDAVQVLEFDGTFASIEGDLSILSITGVFPGLKVIRVGISRGGCKVVLQFLATALRRRMGEGNPPAAIEPLFAEGEDGLGRVEWEEHCGAEGIHNFLSR